MDNNFREVKVSVYDKCSFVISDFKTETESQEYYACQYKVNESIVISRTAKITPKKLGQFVTFWKRNGTGPIEPFEEKDLFDFFVINTRQGSHFGQFVFPKSILIKNGIVSTIDKEGKRAFRVYPPWDIVNSQQAVKAQKWQLDYFHVVNESIDLIKLKETYSLNC